MKQNKKAEIWFVIHIAGERKLLFYIYAVIVKQIFYKRSTNYYSRVVAVKVHAELFAAALSKLAIKAWLADVGLMVPSHERGF